jgi:hypothetical protein
MIDGFHKIMGFQNSDADENMYFKGRGKKLVILITYVDDLFLTVDEGIISWCKMELIS